MVAGKKYWWGKKILFFIHPTFKVKEFVVECYSQPLSTLLPPPPCGGSYNDLPEILDKKQFNLDLISRWGHFN